MLLFLAFLIWLVTATSTLNPEPDRTTATTNNAMPHPALRINNANPTCDCAPKWCCKPHDACFIHESCLCPGSRAFPPVRPPKHEVKLFIGHAGHRPPRHKDTLPQPSLGQPPRHEAKLSVGPLRHKAKLSIGHAGQGSPKQEAKLLVGCIGHKSLHRTMRRVSHIEACIASQMVGNGSMD